MGKTYVHQGIVVDTEPVPAPGGLRVELWDAEGIAPELIGYTLTEDDGRFEIHVHEEDLTALFADRPVELAFRVILLPNTQLADTTGTQSWRVGDRPSSTRIIVNTRTGSMITTSNFNVRGRALDASTGPLTGSVSAYDRQVDGERKLGSSATIDARGFFEISYDPYHATTGLISGKTLGDIFVRHDTSGDESPVRYQAGPTAVIDLIVGGAEDRGEAEQSAVTAAITPFVGSASLGELTDEDIDRTAQAIRRTAGEVRAAAKAKALKDEVQSQSTVTLSDEVLYGLLRQGLPEDRAELLQIPQDQLREALQRAMDARSILELDTATVTAELQRLRDASVGIAKEGADSLGAILDLALNATDRDSFLSLYSESEATVEAFWTSLSDPFGTGSVPVANLQYLMQIAAIGRYYKSFVAELYTRYTSATAGWRSLEELADHSADTWETEIIGPAPGKDVGAPPDTSLGSTEAEREANYAKLIERTLESWLTTRSIAARVKAASPGSDLEKFFSNNVLISNPAFEFGVQRVESFWSSANLTGVVDTAATKATLKKMERLYRVTPRHEEMDALMNAGFGSATSIVHYGKARFVADHAAALGGDAGAKAVYQQAKAQSAAAVAMQLLYSPGANGPSSPYLPDYAHDESNPDGLVSDWQALFGAMDGSKCAHCDSVFSAAAYLVDLLLWLGQHESDVPLDAGQQSLGNWTVKELLLGGSRSGKTISGRRADLAKVGLTCANTKRTLPYIDLVMELLEERVSPAAAPPDVYETLAAGEELQMAPQTFNKGAYDTLVSAIYPWSGPYSLWHQQSRLYLGHLGVSRHALMKALQHGTTLSPTNAAIAQEFLGMTAPERLIIVADAAAPSIGDPWAYWGFSAEGNWTTDLKNAASFIAGSQASYDELREFLDSGFITTFTTGGAQPTLERAAGYSGNDPSQLTITGLVTAQLENAWKGSHRFLRLARRLGWSIRDFDKIKTSLAPNTSTTAIGVDDAFIEAVADVQRLRERFDTLPLAHMAAWWGPLDVQASPSVEERSLYEQLFVDRWWDDFIANPTEFWPHADSGSTHDLSDHLDRVLGAIGMSASDYELVSVAAEARAKLWLPAAFAGADTAKVERPHLSRLFRLASLARAMGIPVADLVTLQALTGLAPLQGDASSFTAGPAQTLQFVQAHDKLAAYGLSVPEAHYLLRHVSSAEAAEDAQVARLVEQLEGDLQQVQDDTAHSGDTSGEALRALVERLVASESEDMTDADVTNAASTIWEITVGQSALPLAAQRAQLQHILDPFVADADAIADALEAAVPIPDDTRVALVEKPLRDFERQARATALIKQSMATALAVPQELSAALLTQWLTAPSDAGKALIEDLLPPTYGAPEGPTTYQRREAAVRFSKAATIARRFEITADDLAWLQGQYRDSGWLDLNDLPVAKPEQQRFDAAELPPAEGALQLPSWMTVTCATTDRTAHASASTVNVGLGTDAPRTVSFDGNGHGLLVEPAGTNLLQQQDLTQWTAANAPVLTDAVDPSGDTITIEITDSDTATIASVQTAVSQALTVGNDYTVSAWSRVLDPATTSALVPRLDSVPQIDVGVAAPDDGWMYRDAAGTMTTASTPQAQVIPHNMASSQGAVRVWGLQVEERSYPTSFIGADNTNFSRAADVVAIEPSQLDSLDGGYFRMTLRYAPLYAHNETSGDHDLLYISSAHHVFYRASDQKIVVQLHNVVVAASAALTFDRHQQIAVQVVHASDHTTLTITGCTTGDGTTDVSGAQTAITWPASAYLLGDAGGAQEGATLWQIQLEAESVAADLSAPQQRYTGLMRLGDVMAIHKRLADRGGSLFELLGKTAEPNMLTEAQFQAALAEQAGWPLDDVATLATAHELVYPDAYRSDVGLGQLARGMDAVSRIGASASTCLTWLDVDTAAAQEAIAEGTMQAARAKHGDDAWPEVAASLRDEMREAQQAALVAYILQNSSTLQTADDLYDDLLVDVEMSACGQTSRVKQAIGSVQLFVHRTLLGLEQVTLNKEAREQWRWRKSYRVWEANRKVLLYPENWLEPELRATKTPLFEALEAELRQRPVTAESAEAAYRHYLAGLEAIARLDVGGMLHHKQAATEEYPAIDELHVFGRTPGASAPHKLYHRKWVDRSHWTPWVEVPVESSSPVFLPVLEHGRLRLHWLDVVEQEVPQENLPPARSLSVMLLTSHYQDGQWSPREQTNAIDIQPFEMGQNASSLLLAIERSTSGPKHSQVNLYTESVHEVWDAAHLNKHVTTNLVLHAVAHVDPCTGAVAKLQPMASVGVHMDLLSRRPVGSISNGGLYQLPASGELTVEHWSGPAKLLTLSDGVTGSVQAEHVRTGDVEPILGVFEPEFQPIDTFFLHADNRVLFGYLDPVPSENEPLSPLDGYVTAAEASKVPPKAKLIIDSQFAHGDTAYNDMVVANNVKAKNRPDFAVHIRPFSHPFVCDAREALYRYGLDGLRRYDTLPAADPNAAPLQETYDDTWFTDYVPPSIAYVATPYPADKFEFRYGGAFSEYNWELFFHVPLLLATWLKRAGRYEDALSWLRAIFDPTDGDNDQALDVWRFKPLRDITSVAALQSDLTQTSPTGAVGKWLKQLLGGSVTGDVDTSIEQQIHAWMNDPFNPHLVAQMRPTAYQKAVAALYIETLIAWGDKLFRRDTIESLVEAQQLYMLARRLLGERPKVYANPPEASPADTPTFSSVEDDLTNGETAVEQSENLLPVQPMGPTAASEALASFGAGGFCVPHNKSFVKLWDTVDDRLFKLRNCMNLAGIVRQLPLFQPPIDPDLLIKAKAAGMDLDSVLDQLNAPAPLHRFPLLYGRAMDAAGYVVQLGGALLAALEKGDGEHLSMLRSNHEVALLKLVKDTRKAQVDEAREALAALKLSRRVTEARLAYYQMLIDGGLNAGEEKALELTDEAKAVQVHVSNLRTAGAVFSMIPQNLAGLTPGVIFGGQHIGQMLNAIADGMGRKAAALREQATMEATKAGYQRREQEWDQQQLLAERELAQINRQIIAAEIRVDIASKELATHEEQIRQSQEVNDVIERKFTNEQLYLWMAGKLSELYFQAYKLAFDLARRAERAFQAERAMPDRFFVQFGYWDGLHKGLLAGEQLQLDLRRMDAAYLETDRREYELTKSISLAEYFPAELIALRETGSTEIELSEAHFDLDYPGHYLRRIKNVSLTLPAVTGPHSSVNCTLTLLNSKIRHDASTGGGYAEDPGQDDRFYYHFGQVRSVCTSSGVGDAGLFELSFRDDRLLPFEGAGTASRWRLDLPQATNRFDLRSVTDVVLQVQYTAREGGAKLQDEALNAASGGLLPTAKRLVSVASEYAAEWDAFETTLDAQDAQVLTVTFDEMLPYVPGTGPVRMRNLYLALDIDHANAGTTTLNASVTPAGTPAMPALQDASKSPLAVVDYTAAPVDTTGTSWAISIAQTDIAALPADMREEYPVSSGVYRLKPSVFRDLLLVLDLERDALS